MVIPRSRSMSILSSTWALPLISRSVSPPVAWISRSASVDLPWSICAMMLKLRILLVSVMGSARYSGWRQGGNRHEASERAGTAGDDWGGHDHWSGAGGQGSAADRQLLDGRRDPERARRRNERGANH